MHFPLAQQAAWAGRIRIRLRILPQLRVLLLLVAQRGSEQEQEERGEAKWEKQKRIYLKLNIIMPRTSLRREQGRQLELAAWYCHWHWH